MDHFIEYENVPVEEICRLCISERKSIEIFSSSNLNTPKYSELANSLGQMDIESVSDEFPSGICNGCASKLMEYYEFKLQIKKSHAELITLMKADDYLESSQLSTSTNDEVKFEQIEEVDNEKKRQILLKIVKSESYCENQNTSHENNFNSIYDENNEINMDEICRSGDIEIENLIKEEVETSLYNGNSESTDHDQASDQYDEEKIETPNVRSELQCSICEKVYKSKHTLKSHMYVHTGELNFQCTECGKRFGQQKLLKAHMEVIHIKSKFYYCDTCGRQFNRKNNLLKHQWVHRDGGRFSCQHCGKLFKWENSFKAHQTTHTNERPHECLLCKKNFKAYSSLKKHCTKLHDGYGLNLKVMKTDLILGS